MQIYVRNIWKAMHGGIISSPIYIKYPFYLPGHFFEWTWKRNEFGFNENLESFFFFFFLELYVLFFFRFAHLKYMAHFCKKACMWRGDDGLY